MAETIRRVKVPLYERMRRPAFIVGYSVLAEMSDPRPFLTSTFGKFLYLLLIVSVIQEMVYLRMERSAYFYARVLRSQARPERFKSRWTINTRYRIGRAVRYVFLVYAYGWLLNGLVDTCASPISCVVYTPNLIRDAAGDIVYFAFIMLMSVGQFVLIFWFMSRFGTYEVILPETIKDRFSDVYGQDRALDQLKEQLRLLEHGEDVEALGGYMPKGVLLWGPPGTGKTLMMRAMAGESSVPFIYVGPGSFTNMFMGVNILKVKRVFKAVRTYALRYGGAIVFFDEIDSLGNRGGEVEEGSRAPLRWWNLNPHHPFCKRAGTAETSAPPAVTGCYMSMDSPVINVQGGGGGQQGTLETFLAEMDGMEKPRGLINILRRMLGFKPLPPPDYKALFAGATNLRSKLDAALLRSGRLSKQIKVPYPKVEGKIKTFEGYLDKVPNEVTDEMIETLSRFASRASGADIQEFVNEALLRAVRNDRTSVTEEDLREAIIYKVAGDVVGRQETPEDEMEIAIHEAGHAVAAHHLRDRERWGIAFATIIERTSGAAGAVFSYQLIEKAILSQNEVMDAVAISLGSRVVEEMFDIQSMGHGGDGPAATRAAQGLVMVGYGANLSTIRNADTYAPQRDPSEYHQRVDSVLRDGMTLARETLTNRREQVFALAQLMVEEGTVGGDEIHALLNEMEDAE